MVRPARSRVTAWSASLLPTRLGTPAQRSSPRSRPGGCFAQLDPVADRGRYPAHAARCRQPGQPRPRRWRSPAAGAADRHQADCHRPRLRSGCTPAREDCHSANRGAAAPQAVSARAWRRSRVAHGTGRCERPLPGLPPPTQHAGPDHGPGSARQQVGQLRGTLFLPVLLRSAAVRNFDAQVHIWSSPFPDAVDFGVAARQWTRMQVLAPQIGQRLLVLNAFTGGPAG